MAAPSAANTRIEGFSMSEISVRPARSADLPRLRELYIEMTAHHHALDARYADAATAAEEAKHFFDNWLTHSRALLVVAESEAFLAGFGLIALQKPHMAIAALRTARIDLLAVGTAFRRRGIGTALTTAMLQWAERQSAEAVFVSHAVQNPAATAFWSRFGFADFSLTRSLSLRPGASRETM